MARTKDLELDNGFFSTFLTTFAAREERTECSKGPHNTIDGSLAAVMTTSLGVARLVVVRR